MPITRYEPGYDLQEERLERLRTLFPEAFADGELDWDALRDLLGAPLEEGDEYNTYGLFWPGKRAARRAAALPPRDALAPAPGEGVDEETTRNVFIEGDNLEVLKLLRKAYAGRVKMIYIDPPYNTGKDLLYHDDFAENEAGYLERTAQVDDLGRRMSTNPPSAGRFHSNWLDMMRPRLSIARELLRNDGLLIVSIDDNEAHNLRALLNEAFGEENYVATIAWNSTKSVTNTALVSVSHNYHIIYARDVSYFITHRGHLRLPERGEGFANPDDDPRGPWKADPFQVGGWRPNQQYEIVNPRTGVTYRPNPGCSWKNDYARFRLLEKDNRIVFGVTGEAGPQRKRFLSEAKDRGRVTKTWWDDVGTTASGTRAVVDLFDGVAAFSNPKPVDLLERLIQLGDHTASGLILDFFAGSCTTAHAVLSQNRLSGATRRYIMVQLPEPIPENDKDWEAALAFCSRNRLPSHLAEVGKERIRRVVSRMRVEGSADGSPERTGPEDLGFRVFRQVSSNYRQWRDYEGQSVSEYQSQLAGFTSPLVEGWDPIALRTEVMLAQGFPLDSRIARCDALPHNAVDVISHEWCEHRLWVCLDEYLAPETVHALSTSAGGYEPEDVFVCLDSALSDEARARLDDRCHVVII